MPAIAQRRLAPPQDAGRGLAGLIAAVLALATVVLTALALALPAPALAEDTQVAHDAENNTYTDIDKAWDAALAGKVVYMDADWYCDGILGVYEGTSVTLKMCGHKVCRDYVESGDGAVFWVYEGATLVLDGSRDGGDSYYSTDFTVACLTNRDHREDKVITAGGLVTGGHSNNSAGGIEMRAGSTVELVNVAVVGNKAYSNHGGGVRMHGKNCSLVMTDSQVSYNAAASNWAGGGGYGGGVYMSDEGDTITMDGSHIDSNWGEGGSGVYANGKNASITMDNGSTIDGNTDCGSNYGGGGIYFDDDNFHLISKDRTASVSRNTSQNEHGGAIATGNDSNGEIDGVTFSNNQATQAVGGAIYADSSSVAISNCKFSQNGSTTHGGALYSDGDGGSVKNCTFEKNFSSGGSGGAMYLEHKDFKAENCTFTGNYSSGKGGSVYVDGADCTFTGCTFTGNYTAGDGADGGAIYLNSKGVLLENCTLTGNKTSGEGGAVFANWNDNFHLNGVVRIYGNTRTDGAADDLFLDSTRGQNIWAYIVCTTDYKIAKGSWIGIRTGIEDQKRDIAQGMDNYIEGTIFLDQPDILHLTYSESDEKLYHEKSGRSYRLSVNGSGTARYDGGTAAKVDARDYIPDSSKVFWKWDESASTGLPGNVSLTELVGGSLTNPVVSLTMPTNDVALAAVYADRLNFVTITMAAPECGVQLPRTATVGRMFSDDTIEASVSWCKVTEDGDIPTGGKAERGVTYVATVTVPQVSTSEFCWSYALDMTKGNCPLYLGGNFGSNETASVSVDATTGTLTVITEAMEVKTGTVASVDALTPVSIDDACDTEYAASLVQATVKATTEDGSEVELGLDVAGIDWSKCVDSEGNAMLDADGAVREPADDEETHSYTVPVALKAPEGVSVPDGVAASLEVVVGHHRRTVSFLDADGNLLVAEVVAWGGNAEEPDELDMSREGYDFLGWYLDGADTAYAFSTPVKSDIDLVARWDLKDCTVTFSSPGATPETQTATVKWGQAAGGPAETPVRDSANLAGWHVEGTGEAYDPTSPVTSSLTLVADWSHTVTFDPANGEDGFSVEVADGRPCLTPDKPSRAGFVFRGWYLGSSEYVFSTPVTSNLALTALWDAAAPTSFIDVPADQGLWYYDPVTQAAQLGLMTGYRNGVGVYTGYFGPEDPITRGQVATVLWRAAGSPEPKGEPGFSDVADPAQFYYKAVAWCRESGVVTGYESGPNAGRFLPGADVTREELAVMVYRFENHMGVDTSGAPSEALDACTDAASVSAWARDAAVWCAAAGVMSGKDVAEGGKRLDPREGATRAQAAKMLVRAWLIASGQDGAYRDGWDEAGDDAQPGESGDASDQGGATFEDVATFDGVDATEAAGEPSAAERPAGTTDERPAVEDTVAEQPADGEAIADQLVPAEPAADPDATFDGVALDQAA